MEKLFNVLNMGYRTNSSEVKVTFKKKYIFFLEKLLKINCIHSYTFNNEVIHVKLRYYKNKPLFFFSIQSTNGNKNYKKVSDIIYRINNCSNLSLLSTNKGLLTLDEAILNKVGGKLVVNIYFLDKK